MSVRNNSTTLSQDSDFHMAFGWLAAVSTAIVSWVGLS